MDTLPTDREGTFENLISRIQKLEYAELGMRGLMWIHLASDQEPLTIEELRHALAVRVGHSKFDRLNISNSQTILKACLGMVIVNQPTKEVRFIHYSAQEYLRQKADEYFPNRFTNASEVCLSYFNTEEISFYDVVPKVEECDKCSVGTSLCCHNHLKEVEQL